MTSSEVSRISLFFFFFLKRWKVNISLREAATTIMMKLKIKNTLGFGAKVSNSTYFLCIIDKLINKYLY